MKQFALPRTGLAEFEKQSSAALFQHLNLVVGDVGDIQAIAGDGQIHRTELTFDAESLDEAVVAVIDQHLVAPRIRDIAGAVGVDPDIDRALDAAGAGARHETEALLRQIENRQPAGAGVGHIELALVQGDAIGLRQALGLLLLADDEVGEAVLLHREIALTGDGGQVLDARRIGQRRVEDGADGGVGDLLGLARVADACREHRRGGCRDDAPH